MPLPVAHTGIGLACYLGFLDDRVTALTKRKKGILLLILVGLANLPDLDFLLAYSSGNQTIITMGLRTVFYRYFLRLLRSISLAAIISMNWIKKDIH